MSRRKPREKNTPSQQAYLVCYDRVLRARTEEERYAAEQCASRMLDLMREDAARGITGSDPRRRRQGLRSAHDRHHTRKELVEAGCEWCDHILSQARFSELRQSGICDMDAHDIIVIERIAASD